ncbi:cation diffusion facilitator family transporter [Oceanibacterium hippocampi]|uniref:Cation-efflux pump FieF n=1 Tax=Oceanibacterium hippocampi TaxID=745714 RepID=A0A1Y5SBN9_9PROT|nr:cation diffusion facilitator family transporter [Oceanibacterium hippocampi]SLN35948.1 Ferrous-iron efflux pump FieF [Oceanibacterium hippocampi]
MSEQATPVSASAVDTERLMRRATYASVTVAAILIAAKLVAYWLSGSVVMLSMLVDSMLDAAASLINLLAVRHALTPADTEHRFGHGKAEPLAGLFQSAFIAGSAVFLLFESANRALHPQPIQNDTIGIAVMVLSIALTSGLVLFQRHVIRQTASVAISADSLHYFGDLLTNAAAIVALILAGRFGLIYADPLFGIAIALYIGWTAWQILRSAFDHLMDRELPDELRERIQAIALAHEEVRAMHDLRTRAAGMQTFIQFHLELDGKINLLRAHNIAEQVEAEILAEFPEAEVIIHQDPVEIDEPMPDFAKE